MTSKTFDKKVSKRKAEGVLSPGSYDYSGLAHWWAYNFGYKQTGGEVDGVPRMSIKGNWVYSFGTVIARMFDPPKGSSLPLVLIRQEDISATTSRHKEAVYSAVHHMSVIYVQNPDPYLKVEHRANLSAMLSDIYIKADLYSRAKSRKDEYLQAISSRIEDAKLYAEVFKLTSSKEFKSIVVFEESASSDLDALVKKSKKEMELAKKRRERERAAKLAKKEAEKAERAKEELELWLNFEREYFHGGQYIPDVRLRVGNGIIETTQGASIPFREAKIAMKRFDAGKLSDGMHIGPYIFKGVDEDGYAHIGCHAIKMEEIREALSKDPGEEKKEPSLSELVGELNELGMAFDPWGTGG
jgi:hypothetical protein